MNRKIGARTFYWTSLIMAVICALFCAYKSLYYRFNHPDLSETRLFMEMWPWYIASVANALLAANWWANRPWA